ncbi:MAG TPA: ABC transporter permease [Actinomycetota bacterium]|nr:ABC transporter permease [Actinomycetota bacterium]
MKTETRPRTTAPPGAAPSRHLGWFGNPWRKPRILEGITWLYLAWSVLPVIVAVVFSFNQGRSRSAWQGFSLTWWWEDPYESLFKNPLLRPAIFQSFRLAIFTTLLAVPIGTAFAIGLDRWRGRPAKVANFSVLMAFVVPEIILGLALLLSFQNFLTFVPLGTAAQVIGLVTWQIAYAVIIVRARLLTIGREYEEAAMDLGASPTRSIRRVLLPLLTPAMFASAAIVFADSIDDFVTVRYLSAGANTEPLSVKIYNAARASPTPAVNAAATFMLVATFTVITVGFFAYRYLTRGQRREGAVKEFVSFEV